jgi:hypothetical protein
MVTFVRRWSWEIAIGVVALFALGIGTSLTTNRQLAYAPCLAKVVTALRADPAAARWSKISAEEIEAEPTGCAVADDVARDASRAIGDLLSSDTTLYDRLPRLLADAGMACISGELSIVCDCKSGGPFAIANPCWDCSTLVDLPLPFKRALFVAVEKRTAVRNGKTVQLGKYMVEVSYATALIEAERPRPPVNAAPGSYAVIDGGYEW